MAATSNPRQYDDLDALLDDGPEDQAPPNTRPDIERSQRVTRMADAQQSGRGDLGIDEQIKVRKPRAPTAKLDEERLLSEKGIPRLRRITKERLRLKGKGHEFSDVAHILQTYQLWLDDLFPKANFTDGLDLIERLGHKKRMQIMRREWINEDKPKASNTDDEDNERELLAQELGRSDRQIIDKADNQDMFVADTENQSRQRSAAAVQSDLPEHLYNVTPGRDIPSHTASGRDQKDSEGDELDALLGQDPLSSTARPQAPPDDEFADEMEAMGDSW